MNLEAGQAWELLLSNGETKLHLVLEVIVKEGSFSACPPARMCKLMILEGDEAGGSSGSGPTPSRKAAASRRGG